MSTPRPQSPVLAARYRDCLLGDVGSFVLILAQAPLIGWLCAVVWGSIESDTPALYFVLCLSAVWFGCINACREIVKERAILERERLFGLRPRDYVVSKVWVLAALGAAQVVLLQGTVEWHLQRRKRYGSYDSRGRLAGKRPISERPAGAQNRSRVGHLEADTVIGTSSDKHCVLTFVDRKTGYVMIGKLEARTVEATNRRAVRLIKTAARPTHTITADNGTEFHGYGAIEAETGSKFYFAAPYHSWERGTSENTNGLIRQYLPKRTSMAHITQHACNRIAHKLNTRPRKRFRHG